MAPAPTMATLPPNDPNERLLDLPGSLWDLLPAAVYVCDRHGLILHYNRRAAELWGRAPAVGEPTERFCGSLRMYRLDGGPVPHAECPMAEVLRTGLPVRDQEIMIERPDGTRAVALVNIDVLRNRAGAIVGAVNCFHDITERKRVESELRTSQRDLEDFFENGAVALHWVSEDGTILRANKAELDLLGYAAEEYVGRSIAEFHADRDTIEDILGRLARGERLDKNPARLRAKDGSIKHVQISSNARFISGAFAHTRCFTVDVTAQQLVQAELRESERRSRELLESLPAAIYTTDADGRITFYNRAAVELAGREPTLGSDEWCVSWKLYTPDGTALPHDRCPMALALKENRPIRGVGAVAERPDGTRVPFLPYPTPLHDASGRLVGAINMLVDISERQAAEEALRTQTYRFERLNRIAKMLSTDLDLERIVQTVTDSATELSGAKFGAFFYNVADDQGERYRLCSLSGAPREAFAKFELPRWMAVLEPTFRGTAIVRSDDIRADPRYGRDAPHFANGQLPVVSYLAVPVVSRSGQVHGGLFVGHDEAGKFTQESENIVAGIAAHAALAIDNARLLQTTRTEVEQRKRAGALLEAQKRALELMIGNAPLAQALDTLVRTIEALSTSGMLGSVLLLDRDGLRLRHGAAPGLPDAYSAAIDGVVIGPNVGSCGTAAWTKKPVYVADIATDPLWIDFRELALSHGLCACWSTPILSAAGDVLGTFAMYYRTPRESSAEDMQLVEIAARTASLIIERKRVEDAVRQRTAQFETLLNEAPLGVFLVDADFRIREVNPTARPAFGDIPGLLGRDFEEVVRIVWPKEYADEVVQRFRHTLDTGEPYFTPERIERRQDRGVIEYYEWRISRIPLPDGSHGVVCYFRDVSAQVHTRQAIAESEQRFRALVDASAQIVWTANADGVVVEDSPSWRAFTGQSYEQWKGLGWLDAIHPDDRERVSVAWQSAVRKQASIEIDYRVRHFSGDWRWMTARGTPFFARDGSLKAYVGMNTDITASKQAQEQQGLLLREMSHRIKNLFAVASGMVALSARSARTPQAMAASVQERLAALTRAHDLTRPGLTGAADTADQNTTLHTLIRAIFAPYVNSGGGVTLTGPDLPIGGNATTSLALVLHEFATNAAKYGSLSSPEGAVSIECSFDQGELLLQWREHGGPVVKGQPEGEGFGGLLTRRIIADQFGGRISRNWAREGLIVHLSVPLDRLKT